MDNMKQVPHWGPTYTYLRHHPSSVLYRT